MEHVRLRSASPAAAEHAVYLLRSPGLRFSLALDEEALAWADGRAWHEVYEACPWATAFQSPSFFKVWTRHYRATWRPLLVVAHRADGSVAGLMPLGQREGAIVGAGAHQAEYHGWICSEGDAAAFIVGAFETLAAAFPRHLVRLRYLSYAMPTAAVAVALQSNARVAVHRHPAPTLDIDPAAIQRKLRKSSTRSKAQRLRHLGRLQFSLMPPAAVAREIDQIIAMCDFRQGAINGDCPFVDDPIKRPFHLDWLRSCPDQARCGTLLLDDRIIAALLFVKSGADYHLAIAAHDPRFSEHSPNKLNMYETALALSAEGGKVIDLTPGGDPWKARFSSHDREALELVMHGSAAQAAREKHSQAVKIFARRLLSAAGLSIPAVRQRVSDLRESFTRLRSRTQAAPGEELYRGPVPAPPGVHDKRVAIDPLQVMILCGPGLTRRPRQKFLSEALSRLEQGDRCFVVLDEAGQSAVALGWQSRMRGGDNGDAILMDGFAAAPHADVEAAGLMLAAMLAHRDGAVRVYARASRESSFEAALLSMGFSTDSDPGFVQAERRLD